MFKHTLGLPLCLACGLAACGGGGASVTLPHFNDITTAPSEIQTAARAVVRVRTAGEVATGFLVSPSGLLVTNNHVLGFSVCPLQGCYVELTQMHERGQPRQQPSIVFAVPTTVDAGLDMALLQFYDQAGNQLSTPSYLSFNAEEAASLLNQHVTIVGHPEGALKKWTDGQVTDANGQWITTTAYTLPGDSGSPILNDQGQVVGLLHRGPTSEDLFAENGVDMYSLGTASAPIVAAMAAPPSPPLLSAIAATTKDQFLAYDSVYLNARIAHVTVDGVSTSAVSVLGEACDAALARTDFISPEDLSRALSPCYHAQTWIDCRYDIAVSPFGVVCPADQATWISRYQRANQLWLDMNGQPDYYSMTFAMAHLQPSMSAGVSAGAQSLQQVLSAVGPVLDFRLAYYLAAFAIGSYGGTEMLTYVSNYKQVSHYEMQAYNVFYAAIWLNADGSMGKTQLQDLLEELLADPSINVSTRLALEDYLYRMDAF